MTIDYHDLTAITDTLKFVYGEGITNQFNAEALTYHQFPKSDRKPSGLGYQFSIRYARAQGTGGRGESAKLPDPLVGKFDKGKILPKYLYGSIRLTGPMIEAAKSDMDSFVNGLADSMDDIYQSIVMDMNRQCHSDGFGLLATMSAAATLSTSAEWTVTCDNDTGMTYVNEGMLVDIYTGATIAASAYPCACRVASVDLVNKTCAMELNNGTYTTNHPNATIAALTPAGAAIASGGLLVKMGARSASHATTDTGFDIIGLDGIFDDTTLLATYEDIAVATYPKWKANILGNSSVNRELSIDLMLQAVDLTRRNAAAKKIQMRFGQGQRRKYVNLLLPDVRFAPTQLKGGYETLTFAAGDGSVEIIVDPMTRPNKIYIHPEGVIQKYEMAALGWGNLDQKMHQRSGYDEYDAFLRLYTNLGVEQRNACTLIKDLVEPKIWS